MRALTVSRHLQPVFEAGRRHFDGTLYSNEMLKELQDTNQMSKLMVMNEAVKMLPIGEIWEEYCRRENVCDDFHFYDEIEKYESEVLADRA